MGLSATDSGIGLPALSGQNDHPLAQMMSDRKKSGVIILVFVFCVVGMLRGSGADVIWRDIHYHGRGVCQCRVL